MHMHENDMLNSKVMWVYVTKLNHEENNIEIATRLLAG